VFAKSFANVCISAIQSEAEKNAWLQKPQT
jgi:hypothetical protein